jgi:serine/threonine protein kinase
MMMDSMKLPDPHHGGLHHHHHQLLHQRNVSDDLCNLKLRGGGTSLSHCSSGNDIRIITEPHDVIAAAAVAAKQHQQQQSEHKKSEENKEPPLTIKDQKTNTIYQRGKLLGKGGFARVYEVTNVAAAASSASFADKVINKDIFAKKSSSKEKVKREISLHKDLVHRNVVRFYTHFEDEQFVHIILENCGLKSLLHVLKHRKILTEPEVRYYMLQICEGVRYIHNHDILHRDLKLGNMFLTSDMVVKIGDFGLATRRGAEKSSTLCGTPNYIAPEVLAKKGHGLEADVWALGCMMYAMLVGTPPFETKSLNATYEKIARNDYRVPADHVSALAEQFIRKLLHPIANERGHLLQPGHEQDLLSHDFFHNGFLPSTLPSSATHQGFTFRFLAAAEEC